MIADPKTVLDGVGREAVDFVFRNYRQLALYAAALSLLETVLWRFLPGGVVSDVIEDFVSTGCYIVFAIVVHRWILLDEIDLRAVLSKRSIMFIGMLLIEGVVIALAAAVIFVPFLTVAFLVMLMINNDFIIAAAVYTAFAAAAACALLIIARLIVVFPTIAVTKLEKLSFQSVRAGYEVTNGSALEISKRLAIFFAASVLFFVLVDFLSPYDALPDADGFIWEVLRFSFSYLEFLLSYAPIPLFVALASFIYRRFTFDLQANAGGG